MATNSYPRNSALQSADIAETLLRSCLHETYIDQEDRDEIRATLRTLWHVNALEIVDAEAWHLHRSVWIYGAADLLARLVRQHGSATAEPAVIAIIRQCIAKPATVATYPDGEAA